MNVCATVMNLVAGSDSKGTECEFERIGPGRDTDGVARTDKSAELRFERLELGSEDELARLKKAGRGGIQLGGEVLQLNAKIAGIFDSVRGSSRPDTVLRSRPAHLRVTVVVAAATVARPQQPQPPPP